MSAKGDEKKTDRDSEKEGDMSRSAHKDIVLPRSGKKSPGSLIATIAICRRG